MFSSVMHANVVLKEPITNILKEPYLKRAKSEKEPLALESKEPSSRIE